MSKRFNCFIDPITAGAAISAGAALIGGNQQREAQEQTNRMNIALMREGWARDDSAVQRKVLDLKAAGLHPTLASGGGMSSTPTQIQTPIKENMVARAMESVNRLNDVTTSKLQQELVKAQINNIKANTANTNVDTEIADKENDFFLVNKALRAIPVIGDLFGSKRNPKGSPNAKPIPKRR